MHPLPIKKVHEKSATQKKSARVISLLEKVKNFTYVQPEIIAILRGNKVKIRYPCL